MAWHGLLLSHQTDFMLAGWLRSESVSRSAQEGRVDAVWQQRSTSAVQCSAVEAPMP